ncbi:MAG: exopolysaccharide biosynthesis polyprenyl glycosylphosphotransferase [Ferruginibacter sp.]|nr:exopolysaccharide biosynthesis polyprenyl glycosylphosphotransferase [Ferruginibacter sp.]
MKQPRININWYIICDVISAALTWLFFYFLRTVIYHFDFSIPPGFYLGGILYISGWLSLHFLSGAYESIYHKSAINEFLRTTVVCLIGCLGLLFFFILKNPHGDNMNYYQEFYSLLFPVFFCTLLLRLLFLRRARNQLKNNKVYFNILLIGSGKNASQFFDSFISTNANTGYHITSFLSINAHTNTQLPETIKKYDGLDTINSIIDKDAIEEVIITVEKNERDTLTTILRQLSDKDVNIKITADAVDIISGAVQTSNVTGMPLIDVHNGLLPSWQKNIKRFMDISIAAISLFLLLPLLLYTALRTRLSSKGTVFFRQQRLGFKGKPFNIIKFRSMVQNAEQNGPMLSSSHDPRITLWGKTMRKWRLDELPQLWNIIKGDMSLVGPRPERKFYCDQIVEQRPEYKYLLKVKPGLTSWGMVKFGYASSVSEMIQRMPYDIMYIENISVLLDIRILLQTIRIILSGNGK